MFKEHKSYQEELQENQVDEQTSDEQMFDEETNKECDIVMVGHVYNCFKLNIRKKPDINSSIVGVLDCGKGVDVYVSFENDEFYKVKTFSGNIIEGYCLKEYIDV